MNKEETRQLYLEGKDAWNRWADSLLQEKEQLKMEEKWDASADREVPWSEKPCPTVQASTESWLNKAKADFSLGDDVAQNQDSEDDTFLDFRGFIFPGEANFSKRVFGNCLNIRHVDFDEVVFYGPANFTSVTFKSDANFEKTRFKMGAWFGWSKFIKAARFYDTRFDGIAWFDGTEFCWIAMFERAIFAELMEYGQYTICNFNYSNFSGLRTSFADAKFGAAACFRAIEVKKAFDLRGATFNFLPNFDQSHFSEAPRLDHLKFGDHFPGKSFGVLSSKPIDPYQGMSSIAVRKVEGDEDPFSPRNNEARFRALRRIAAQSHDTDMEKNFLAMDIRSRRGTTDKWVSWGTTTGIVYEICSNFGRSLSRPLLLWCLSIIVFYFVYASVLSTNNNTIQGLEHYSFALSLHNNFLPLNFIDIPKTNEVENLIKTLLEKHGNYWILLSLAEFLQRVVGAIAWFFVLLYLRNRYKLN